jgi:hypothetical protein
MFEARLVQVRRLHEAAVRSCARAHVLRVALVAHPIQLATPAAARSHADSRCLQGALLKKIVEAIKDLVTDANLECSAAGLTMQVRTWGARRLAAAAANRRGRGCSTPGLPKHENERAACMLRLSPCRRWTPRTCR